jgi:hypothetical protein
MISIGKDHIGPSQAIAFERKCIKDVLADKKRVIILQENLSSSHCHFWDCAETLISGLCYISILNTFPVDTMVSPRSPVKSRKTCESNKLHNSTNTIMSCREQMVDDLSAMGERGILQMEGGIL